MQDIVAILIVLGAVAFLARRAWLKLVGRRAGSCGSCASCPSSGSTAPGTVVQIQLIKIQK